jgi:hypothetical protein
MPQTYNDAFAWVKKGDGESDRLNKKKEDISAPPHISVLALRNLQYQQLKSAQHL